MSIATSASRQCAIPAVRTIARTMRRISQRSGRVVYINEAHRCFTAEAEANGIRLRESFKF